MKMCPVVHFEMPAKDRKRVSRFYENALGWGMQQLGEEMGNYILATTTSVDANNMAKEPGAINGGFFDWSEKDSMPHLVVAVDNLDEHIRVMEKQGGKIVSPKMEIKGIGRFAMFVDTGGNRVGMLEPSR
jgi:uncharacterized protein